MSVSKPSLRRKDGQVSVLVAVCLALVLVMAAFGIDIAHVLVQKRHVQNAADAGSLAASNDLPASGPCDSSCQSAVGAQAETYANYNLKPSQQVTLHACVDTDPDPRIQTDNDCFQTPYLKKCAAIPPGPSDPCNQLVQVRIREHVHLWFAGAVPGLAGSIKWVNAKAVGAAHAETTTVTTPGGVVVSTEPDTVVVSTSPDVVTTITTPGGVTTTTTPGGVSTTTIPGGVTTTTIPGATHTTTIPGATHTTTTPGQPGSGEAFAMSRSCTDAITYSGAGGGSIGAIGTNGGISLLGNKPKRVDTLSYNKVGCPHNPDSPPSGTSSCNGTANILCVKTLIDLNNSVVPVNWPLPPPPLPTPRTGTWNAANDYGVNCIDLGATPPTIDNTWASSHAPGVYCSTGTAALTITATNLGGGDGYTFFTLGGGQIIRNSNTTTSKFYWPSGCGARPANRLTSYTCFGRPINGDSNTLFYSTSTAFDPNACANNAICLNGSGNTIQGDGFAPNSSISPAYPPTPTQTGGGVFVAGGGAQAGSGFFEAWEFSVQGNNGLYTGDGPGTGPQVLTITDPSTTVVSTDPDTVTTSTSPGTTNVSSTPGTTVVSTNPGGTTTSTTPGTTTVTVIPGGTTTTVTPPSTQTQTTGTTVALNE